MSNYRLVSHHGTMLYFDTGAGCLRHGSSGTVPENLILEISGDRCRLLYIDPQTLISSQLDDPNADGDLSLKSDDLQFNLQLHNISEDLISISANNNYLSSDSDGSVRMNRGWCRSWECYRIQRLEPLTPTAPNGVEAGAVVRFAHPSANEEKMVENHRNERSSLGSDLDFFRQLFQQTMAGGAIEPEVFDELSRVAAEIAGSLRTRIAERSFISAQMSELFPELAATSAAGMAQLTDEGLDRASAAVQAAAEAKCLLVECEARVRAALDKHDYSSLAEHASRAREHDAAVSAQRELLTALLAPLSDRDEGVGAELDLSPPPGFAPLVGSSDGTELDRGGDDPPPIEDEPPSVAEGQGEDSPELDRASAQAPVSEPDHVSNVLFLGRPRTLKAEERVSAETSAATPIPDDTTPGTPPLPSDPGSAPEAVATPHSV